MKEAFKICGIGHNLQQLKYLISSVLPSLWSKGAFWDQTFWTKVPKVVFAYISYKIKGPSLGFKRGFFGIFCVPKSTGPLPALTLSICIYSIYNIEVNNIFHNCSYSICFYAPVDRRSGAYCLCPVCLSVTLCVCLSRKLNIGYNFWTTMSKAFIFHMDIPQGKAFQQIYFLCPCDLDLWCHAHFLKNLTLPITFELQWVRLLYFTCIYVRVRPFGRYIFLTPVTLTFGATPTFWKTLTLP